MKKGFFIIFIFFGFLSSIAQVIKPTKKASPIKIDTVKTEVVEVITKYNPKIADASKIKKNPTIQLLNKSKKKKLSYTIFSAPVASTFIPKSGVVKGIDVGVKERIYNNYIAAGYGNFNSPYLETYLHSYSRFQSEFGLYAKYTGSLDNIADTDLDSNFSNFIAEAFYKQEERYFDWKVTLNTERNKYNWYGLKENIFIPNTIDNINEAQTYNYFNLSGEIDFLDAYIDKSIISISYLTDDFNSSEFLVSLNTLFDLPIDFINPNLNNLKIKNSFEYLNGTFENDYSSQNKIAYSIFTTKINPEYVANFNGFSLKLGTKFFASFDTENNVNHFLIYPDIKFQKTIIKEQLNIYAGVFGDFHTNTYKNFTEENPYISPTQFITQTAERYNVFLGFNGVINRDISFNISASIKDEQDKAFFIRNNSKSTGINNSNNGILIKGFEYGNSFSVIYDDVKTTSIFAELEYELTKRLALSSSIQFDNFDLTNENEAWNLPAIQTSVKAAYKSNKWFATTNIFYIGERKDVLYSSTSPSSINGIQNLNSFVDINLNGGYHFNDKFSTFLRFNNVLNTSYQRFANFQVQGFQVLGGVTYKFDF